MKSLSDMTDAEKLELAEQAKTQIEAMQRSIPDGVIECAACQKILTVTRHGREWDVTCSCGFSAAGIGGTKPLYQ